MSQSQQAPRASMRRTLSLMTWADVRAALQKFPREDRDDIWQEIQVFRLQYPQAPLAMTYTKGIQTVLRHMEARPGKWASIFEAAHQALGMADHRAEQMMRIYARLSRVHDPDIQTIGLAFLLGWTQTELARQYQVSQSKIYTIIQQFVQDVI